MAQQENNSSRIEVVKLATRLGIEEFESRELAEEAFQGDPASEYIVGTWYEAAGELPGAREWYSLAAQKNYAPAVRKLSMPQFRKGYFSMPGT